MHHAHIAGLVHRDLKPSNILLDTRGDPRVCDFGLAVDEEIQRMRRGEVAGTLPYMAPEQVRGETNRLDGRTDVWALGRDPLSRPDRPPAVPGPDARPSASTRSCIASRGLLASATTASRASSSGSACAASSRPMSDRYLTAERPRRRICGDGCAAPASSRPALRGLPPVVPKGLRAFGGGGRGVLPGTASRPARARRTPESIRFWKTRIEATDGDAGFQRGRDLRPLRAVASLRS